MLGHYHALHLVGALVDLGDLGVAHKPLDGEVLGEAVTAEELHGVSGDTHGRVGGEGLGRRIRSITLPRCSKQQIPLHDSHSPLQRSNTVFGHPSAGSVSGLG